MSNGKAGGGLLIVRSLSTVMIIFLSMSRENRVRSVKGNGVLSIFCCSKHCKLVICSIVCAKGMLLVMIFIFVVESVVVIIKARSEISAFILDGQYWLWQRRRSVLVLILHVAVCFFV